MSLKVLVIAATFAIANAGYLQPALRYAAPAPLVSYTSPAITKTEFIPGSYSSSYRSDVITPRVKYTETPTVAVTIPQPAIAVAPVARYAHVTPAHLSLAHGPIGRVGLGFGHGYNFGAPLAHNFVAPAPLARGHGW